MSDERDQQIEALERRIHAIEVTLGLAAAVPRPHIQPIVTPDNANEPDERGYVQPFHHPAPPPLPLQNPPPLQSPPPLQNPPPLLAYPPANKGIEQTIGLKWAGWVGAIILVIGAALGIQYAYVNHWFGHVSPATRLAMIFAVGVGLILNGEYVFRRVNAMSAVGIYAAGIATLFIAAYAGSQYYDLYSHQSAMFLMVAATFIGAAISMRGNLVSIAVLSLLGAGLAPALVGSNDASTHLFLLYLLMTQCVAMFLASWGRDGKWWTLRGLSLGINCVWMSALLNSPHAHDRALLIAVLAFAALHQAEVIFTLLRPFNAITQAKPATVNRAGTSFILAVWVAVTFGVLIYFDASSRYVKTLWIAELAATAGILGFSLPSVRPSLRAVALSHRIAAAALLVLIIPLAFGGVGVDIGWLVLALAFAVLCRFNSSPISRAAAVTTWALALLRLFIHSQNLQSPDLGSTWLTIARTPIGATVILAWLNSLTGLLIAALIPPRQAPSRGVYYILSALCALVWIWASIACLPPLAATGAIIVYAWALSLLNRANIRLAYSLQAGAVLILALTKWALLDTISASLSPDWLQARPVFNPLIGTGVCALLSLAMFHQRNRRVLHELANLYGGNTLARLRASVVWIVTLLVAWTGSFEIARTLLRSTTVLTPAFLTWHAIHLDWDIWWCLAAVAGYLWQRWQGERIAVPSRLSLWIYPGFISLVILKYLLYDRLAWRQSHAPGSGQLLFLNREIIAAAVLLTAILLPRKLRLPAGIDNADFQKHLSAIQWMACVATLLITLSLEIDRAFFLDAIRPHWNDPSQAKQMALSTFWALFAVMALVIGFARRVAGLRYFALALLAATLLKVVIFDFAEVGYGYRVLSFIALGLLLLGTSVIYGKVSTLLLEGAVKENPKSP